MFDAVFWREKIPNPPHHSQRREQGIARPRPRSEGEASMAATINRRIPIIGRGGGRSTGESQSSDEAGDGERGRALPRGRPRACRRALWRGPGMAGAGARVDTPSSPADPKYTAEQMCLGRPGDDASSQPIDLPCMLTERVSDLKSHLPVSFHLLLCGKCYFRMYENSSNPRQSLIASKEIDSISLSRINQLI